METKKENTPRNLKRYHVFIQIVIYILFGLGPLTGNVILVLFNILSSEFSVNPSAILLAIPSFMFPFAFTQLFAGAISDIKGRIQTILFGLLIFGIGMTLAATSFSLTMFLISNVLGGIGFGFVNPVLIALMTDITEGPKIPKKIGYLGAVANLGVGLGPIIAGQIVSFNWRYLYIFFILVTILGLAIMINLRKKTTMSNQKARFRFFFNHLWQEIRRPVVILMILSTILITQTYLTIITWTSRAFSEIVPENVTGFVIGSAGITGTVVGLVIGYIIKEKGVKFPIIIALICLYLSIFILLFLEDVTNMDLVLYTTIGIIFAGAAGGIFIPSMMYYSQIFSKKRRGALAGLVTAAQFIGTALIVITYDWTFHSGGIQLVYFQVLIISIFLVLMLTLLIYYANKVK
jgi:MFS family permease